MSDGYRGLLGVCSRCCFLAFAMTLALVVTAPGLYWKLKKIAPSSCEACFCDCPPPLSLFDIAPGLANLTTSVAECGGNETEMKNEMRKQFVDLVTEELKLQEVVAKEGVVHMNATFADAWRLASAFQQESEKCNAATETCEVARERAEALLSKERKVTSIWEQRARHLGWLDQ